MSFSTNSSHYDLLSIRKRKNFLTLSKSQKNKNKRLIRNEALGSIARLCRSMGLKINEIKLSPETAEDEDDDLKISVSESQYTKSYKAYIWMITKDMTNISRKKYKLMRKLLKLNDFDRLPSVKSVFKLQHKLNDFFTLDFNNFGYFVSPLEKIKFVCTKFLQSQTHDAIKAKTLRSFKIKLSADTVILSKKSRRLLNFTFNLLDNAKTAMGVYGTHVLGKILKYFSNSFPFDIYLVLAKQDGRNLRKFSKSCKSPIIDRVFKNKLLFENSIKIVWLLFVHLNENIEKIYFK